MKPFRVEVFAKASKGPVVLAADIGGTHCNFAWMQGTQLLVSIHYCSSVVSRFAALVKEVLAIGRNEHGLVAEAACFAAAGPVHNQRIKLTNLPWSIDAKAVSKVTGLSCRVINDFDAIGYGILVQGSKNLLVVKRGKAVSKGTKCFLGAGTGLGKGFLVWTGAAYKVVSSEGGHGDLACHDAAELKLLRYLQKLKKHQRIEWEDVLSGGGIANLYRFLGAEYKKNPLHATIVKANYVPSVITKNYRKDPRINAAVNLFLHYYGAAAKNFALDTFATGGVYIAGGLAATYPSWFRRKIFTDAFVDSRKQQKVLQQIPISVIKNYNVSLYGAGYCAVQALQNKR